MNKEYIGSSFDDFLEEEGIAKEVKKRLEIPISLEKEKAKVRIPVDKVIDNINTYGVPMTFYGGVDFAINDEIKVEEIK
jgi:hypothetical protein